MENKANCLKVLDVVWLLEQGEIDGIIQSKKKVKIGGATLRTAAVTWNDKDSIYDVVTDIVVRGQTLAMTIKSFDMVDSGLAFDDGIKLYVLSSRKDAVLELAGCNVGSKVAIAGYEPRVARRHMINNELARYYCKIVPDAPVKAFKIEMNDGRALNKPYLMTDKPIGAYTESEFIELALNVLKRNGVIK